MERASSSTPSELVSSSALAAKAAQRRTGPSTGQGRRTSPSGARRLPLLSVHTCLSELQKMLVTLAVLFSLFASLFWTTQRTELKLKKGSKIHADVIYILFINQCRYSYRTSFFVQKSLSIKFFFLFTLNNYAFILCRQKSQIITYILSQTLVSFWCNQMP